MSRVNCFHSIPQHHLLYITCWQLSGAQLAGSVYQYFGNQYELGPLNVTHVALGKHFETNPEHVSGMYMYILKYIINDS